MGKTLNSVNEISQVNLTVFTRAFFAAELLKNAEQIDKNCQLIMISLMQIHK